MSHHTVILITDTSVVVGHIERIRGQSALVCRHRVTAEECLSIQDTAHVDALVAAISEAAEGACAKDRPATLIIPIGWCFTHTLELPRGRIDLSAAAYKFEEFLAVPLEHVTCTFDRRRSSSALAIGIATKPLRRLLDRLAEVDVRIERVVPDILCATVVDGLPAQEAPATAGPCGTMLRDVGRRAIAIQESPEATPAIVRTLRCPGARRDRVELTKHVALTTSFVGIEPATWRIVDVAEDAGCDAVLRAAVATRVLPNLAVDALAPKESRNAHGVERTLILAAVFLASLTMYLHTQRSSLQDNVASLRSAAGVVYRSALPGRPLPTNPAMRLASERLRLERITQTQHRGSDDGTTTPRDRLAPLTALREFAVLVPKDIRVNLMEAGVDDQQLLLRGQTGDHRDAERISDALNRVHGLSARPPRTSRIKTGGVEFSIRAMRDDKAAASELARPD